ncbi:MAG: hypothetical protein AABY13_05125 [Nanoarchaeota archaeon]
MRITFSHHEKKDLLKAWFMSSLAFAIATTGLGMALVYAIPIALVTGGLGILLHELMHKVMAARFGIHAEFHSFDTMLGVSVVASVLGFVILAPGAVFFGAQHVDHRRNGMIAIAGPLTNIILALIFLPLVLLRIPGIFTSVAFSGFMINAWLGFFNLIPFMGLDGEKVLAWNPKVFWPAIVFAGILVFGGYYFF